MRSERRNTQKRQRDSFTVPFGLGVDRCRNSRTLALSEHLSPATRKLLSHRDRQKKICCVCGRSQVAPLLERNCEKTAEPCSETIEGKLVKGFRS